MLMYWKQLFEILVVVVTCVSSFSFIFQKVHVLKKTLYFLFLFNFIRSVFVWFCISLPAYSGRTWTFYLPVQ